MTFAELYPRQTRKRSITEILEAIEFKVASIDDAPELARLFETFFEEAHYRDRGIVYSREKSEAWLANVIGRGAVPHLVAVCDGRIVGVCAYELDGTFCLTPVAVMHTIYVVEAHRRSAIGRVLITLVTDLAKNDGACAFHAPIASGMDEQKSLINMFAKSGFEPIGVILGRKL
jgi:L-amino acid N-acyltransferase YncA